MGSASRICLPETDKLGDGTAWSWGMMQAGEGLISYAGKGDVDSPVRIF